MKHPLKLTLSYGEHSVTLEGREIENLLEEYEKLEGKVYSGIPQKQELLYVLAEDLRYNIYKKLYKGDEWHSIDRSLESILLEILVLKMQRKKAQGE